MAMFQVTTSKLKDEATGLRNIKRQLENEITQMRSYSASYLSMWEGPAKQAFVAEVNKHMNLLLLFTNNMEKFAAALDNSANKYESSENRAVQIASDK